MFVTIVEWSLAALAVYVAIGVVFAAFFVTRLVARIDHLADGATVGFRLLIFPASAALWPMLARRVWSAHPDRGPVEHTPHRDRVRHDAARGEA
jgi:hypothetical protein